MSKDTPADSSLDEMRKQNEDFALKALNLFYQHYPPAEKLEEATRFYTAEEVEKAIRDIYPTAATNLYFISQFLEDNGYRITAIRDQFGIVFRWMIR